MDTSQVQASIEAVNKLVKIAVSRNVRTFTQQVEVNTQLQRKGAGQQPSVDAVNAVAEPGVGEQIDLTA